MALPKINPVQTEAWQKLEKHFKAIKDKNMNLWFQENEQRGEDFQISWDNFFVDYSKNRITNKTLELLFELAKETDLKKAIQGYFKGEKINETEDRAVQHMALRQKDKPKSVAETLNRMESFSEAIINGQWRGHSDERITDIVNIGIGGSDLGPKMAVEALSYYRNHLNVHFVSNVDGDQAAEVCKNLNPATTLFIIVSKSFTTLETLDNAKFFRKWLLKRFPKKAMTQHFIAVSSNTEKANKFGIGKKNIFPMWDWVGGRFSLWSAVGLSLCCAIGFNNFYRLLNGAEKMDKYFKNSVFEDTIAVVLGLLSIWYNNFFKAQTQAIVPYSTYLEQLVPYLQQAFMESNGKDISRNQEEITDQMGNIIWGAVGSNAQHAFFPLLPQGTMIIPCDFIGFKEPLHGNKESHDLLMANFFAQTEALLKGKSKSAVMNEMKDNSETEKIAAFKVFKGNKPSTTLLIDKLTPENLGSLLALYEHRIFVEGVIWNIFSYDQWGVELGKQLASNIYENLIDKSISNNLDSSTASLLENYLKGK